MVLGECYGVCGTEVGRASRPVSIKSVAEAAKLKRKKKVPPHSAPSLLSPRSHSSRGCFAQVLCAVVT
eukprot:628038-Rhodomonas_salina.1